MREQRWVIRRRRALQVQPGRAPTLEEPRQELDSSVSSKGIPIVDDVVDAGGARRGPCLPGVTKVSQDTSRRLPQSGEALPHF